MVGYIPDKKVDSNSCLILEMDYIIAGLESIIDESINNGSFANRLITKQYYFEFDLTPDSKR